MTQTNGHATKTSVGDADTGPGNWPEPTTFEEFWPYYLGEHRSPINRGLHYVGTSMAIGSLTTGILTLNPIPIAAAPLFGYGFAWLGHFVVESNRPATFKYPLWSLRGDFKMLRMAVQGSLTAELVRFYGSTSPDADAPQLVRV